MLSSIFLLSSLTDHLTKKPDSPSRSAPRPLLPPTTQFPILNSLILLNSKLSFTFQISSYSFSLALSPLLSKPLSFLLSSPSLFPLYPTSLFQLSCPHSLKEQALTPASPLSVSYTVGFQGTHTFTPYPHLHTTLNQTHPGHPCWTDTDTQINDGTHMQRHTPATRDTENPAHAAIHIPTLAQETAGGEPQSGTCMLRVRGDMYSHGHGQSKPVAGPAAS